MAHDGRGTDILAYWPLWLLLRLWFVGYMGVRVTGSERVPGRGPVLLCGNHRSVWDPLLIGALVRRRASYIAKVELFGYPLLGPVLRMVGAFPVRRHAVDRRAVRRSLQVLQRRGALVLFPEGTRSKTGAMGKGEPGAALLALRTGAAVVPVGIRGGYGFRGGLEVHFGEPLRLQAPDQRLRGRDLGAIVEGQIMGEIARLAGAAAPAAECAGARGVALAAEVGGPGDGGTGPVQGGAAACLTAAPGGSAGSRTCVPARRP